jgi:hypothetical protein
MPREKANYRDELEHLTAFSSSTRQGQAAFGGDCLASGSGNLEIST